MVSKKIKKALEGNSVIRAMFEEGNRMAAEFGRENVYDFSLGNPATPAPEALNEAIKNCVNTLDPMTLHGYMENAGYRDVRETIATNLNTRFGTSFGADNLVMTVGAAGGLNIIFKTILDPGDEVIVFAPFFGEYRQYAANFDAAVVAVNPDTETFMPDLLDFESKFTERTKAVLINTPNNPTGVVYGKDTLRAIADIMERMQEKYQKEIYLISDEPYRELVYDGEEQIFLTPFYRNTFVGYSFSKSLSLPGERIGYVAVPSEMQDFEDVMQGLIISNRTLGFVNAPSLIQKAVAQCLEEKTDVAFYDKNRKKLYEGLTSLGFHCFKPQGAFYLWMEIPIDDEDAFVEMAKKEHLLLVKGSAFACGGYVRIAYCVSPDMIDRSMPAFARLAKVCGL